MQTCMQLHRHTHTLMQNFAILYTYHIGENLCMYVMAHTLFWNWHTHMIWLQSSRINLIQELDDAVTVAALQKTTNAKGELLGQTWKQVHSRIYHAVADSMDGTDVDAEEAKKRTSWACACGKVLWRKKQDCDYKNRQGIFIVRYPFVTGKVYNVTHQTYPCVVYNI